MSVLKPLFIASFVASFAVASAADIVIESRSGGKNFSGYKENAGRWLDSNTPAETAKSSAPGLTPQGELGSRKTTVAAPPGTLKDAILSAARFTPTIETAGDYHVYVTFPKAGNATPVTYVIKHAKGEEKKELTQNGWGVTSSANGNRWVELGTYPFTPGTDQYVELQVTGATIAADPSNPAQAFTDGVRFSTEALSDLSGPNNAASAKSSNGSTAAVSSEPIQWIDTLAGGRTAASSQKKKLFVYFYSPQSERSQEYETATINDAKVKGVINSDFVAVRINMDAQRDLASQLQVFRAGTINIYDSATGANIESISDTPGAEELAKRLQGLK